MAALALPSVTLCAAASVNVGATVAALEYSMARADFAECLLFTDVGLDDVPSTIKAVPIARLQSSRDYSEFMLRGLGDHIRTSHCLVVQWDGFVIDAGRWDPAFLQYDYIGARWPQFDDGYDIGNGGFSLRSRKLLEACRNSRIGAAHPEDVTICRTHREMLERDHGIRFADRSVADSFSFERTTPGAPTFGFHGVFNMVGLLGADRFWQIYRSLDDRSTAFVDFAAIWLQLGSGERSLHRRLRFAADRLGNLFGG